MQLFQSLKQARAGTSSSISPIQGEPSSAVQITAAPGNAAFCGSSAQGPPPANETRVAVEATELHATDFYGLLVDSG